MIEIRNTFNINGRDVIFMHIPKTCGTSIIHALSKYRNSKVTQVRHLTSRFYSEEQWNRSYKFCVIRNPYARMISSWKHHTTRYDGPLFDAVINGDTLAGMPFLAYLRLVKRLIKETDHANFVPMVDYMNHPSVKANKIDRVLKFGNINEDWKKLCSDLKIDIPLGHVNSTNYDHYSKYYTDQTKKIVQSLYRKDFEAFNYGFHHG
jgi:hypothetical protein